MKSGGAAAAAGTEFQKRVAALALAHSLMGVRSFSNFGITGDEPLTELQQETDEQIDDITLKFPSKRVLIQAKRSISLSKDRTSAFGDVVAQFVNQYLREFRETDCYLLATTPDASRKIRCDLKKLTEAARFNETSSEDNPLSKSEREVLRVTRDQISLHYALTRGENPSETVICDIFKRMHVCSLAIEKGGEAESAILLLLEWKAKSPACDIWNALLELSSQLMQKRLSIDKSGLMKSLGWHLQSEPEGGDSAAAYPNFHIEVAGSIQGGRDVVLFAEKTSGENLILAELYRFDAKGNRRLRYTDNTIVMSNGSEFDLLYRSATFVGAKRYIERNASILSDKTLKIHPMSVKADPDEAPFAKLQASKCAHILQQLTEPLNCIICGCAISQNEVSAIEVDQADTENYAGLVHDECRLPAHRVLGIIDSELFKSHPLLRNFDYRIWYQNIMHGRNIFQSANSLRQCATILWNKDFSRLRSGPWCIRVDLEGDAVTYVTERRVVQRYSEVEANETADSLNKSYENGRKAKDPWAYAIESGAYSTYSALLSHIQPGDRILKCRKATPVRYNRAIGSAYSTEAHYYSPLIYLVDCQNQQPIRPKGMIFLISDPSKLSMYCSNWKDANIDLPKFLTSIIPTDGDFDKFIAQELSRESMVVVDPLFDIKGELRSGFVIDDYVQFIEQRSQC